MLSHLYLFPFLFACFVSYLLCAILIFSYPLLRRGKILAYRINDRHIHTKDITRFGGIVFLLSFLVVVALDKDIVVTQSWWGIIISASMLLIAGFWDDIRELSWKIQLFFQALAAGLVFFFNVRINALPNIFGETIFLDSGFLLLGISFVASVLWIVIIINAINWFDGIDGLSGSISLMGFLALFAVSLKPEVYQPPVAILSLILAGISLGFLIWNFPPARMFAGTGGVWFLGFMLAVLAIFSGMKVATSMLVLFFPLVDAVWVVYDRLRSGVSLFNPDNRHLHHRLLDIGWSQKKIVITICSATFVIAFAALYFGPVGKGIIFCLMFVVSMAMFELMHKKKQ